MIQEKFGLGDGPDAVLECTGAQVCIQTGAQLVRKGGMYAQAGMGREVSGFFSFLLSSKLLLFLGSSIHTDLCPECHIPNQHCLYSRSHHPRLNTIHDQLLQYCR